MGGAPSQPDISPETIDLLNRCSEEGKRELKRMMEAAQRLKEDYIRYKRPPFGVKENPEVEAIRSQFTRKVLMGNLGGAGLCYFMARALTRYDTRAKRTVLRVAATFLGGFVGLSWAVSTGLPAFAVQYLEKSNWGPRLLCKPIGAFAPCVEDFRCKSLLDQEKSGRVFLECFRVCQRRADLWATAQSSSSSGGDDDSPPTEMFDESAAFEAPALGESSDAPSGSMDQYQQQQQEEGEGGGEEEGRRPVSFGDGDGNGQPEGGGAKRGGGWWRRG